MFLCIPIVNAELEILDRSPYRIRKLWKLATRSHSTLEELLAQRGFQLSKACFDRKPTIGTQMSVEDPSAFPVMLCPLAGHAYCN